MDNSHPILTRDEAYTTVLRKVLADTYTKIRMACSNGELSIESNIKVPVGLAHSSLIKHLEQRGFGVRTISISQDRLHLEVSWIEKEAQ